MELLCSFFPYFFISFLSAKQCCLKNLPYIENLIVFYSRQILFLKKYANANLKISLVALHFQYWTNKCYNTSDLFQWNKQDVYWSINQIVIDFFSAIFTILLCHEQLRALKPSGSVNFEFARTTQIMFEHVQWKWRHTRFRLVPSKLCCLREVQLFSKLEVIFIMVLQMHLREMVRADL